MTRIIIAHLLEQLTAGFDGGAEYSLLGNTRQIDGAMVTPRTGAADRSTSSP